MFAGTGKHPASRTGESVSLHRTPPVHGAAAGRAANYSILRCKILGQKLASKPFFRPIFLGIQRNISKIPRSDPRKNTAVRPKKKALELALRGPKPRGECREPGPWEHKPAGGASLAYRPAPRPCGLDCRDYLYVCCIAVLLTWVNFGAEFGMSLARDRRACAGVGAGASPTTGPACRSCPAGSDTRGRGRAPRRDRESSAPRRAMRCRPGTASRRGQKTTRPPSGFVAT
jgi:hypothetical protein